MTVGVHGARGERFGLRALTLLELLVAMFLAALLLTVLVRVTSLVYRVGHEEMQRGALEARVMVAVKKLQGDLLATAPAGVTLSPGESQLLLHPIKEVLTSGRVTFEDRFLHWSHAPGAAESSGRLTRTELFERPDGEPFDFAPYRWTPEQLATLAPGAGAKTSLVVDGVTSFSVTNGLEVDAPYVGSLLDYQLAVELLIASTRRTIQLSGSCQLRSGGV